MAYLDIHAHSGRKSIFMYGPYFPLHSSKYMKIRAIPKLVSERTEMFRFFSCKFKVEKYKENCARIAIWRDFDITNVFTVETSSFGFLNKERETVHFNTGLLQEFGECMVHSIFEFNLIQEEDRKMKIELAKKLKAARKTKRMTIAEILGNGQKPKPKEILRIGSEVITLHTSENVSPQKTKEKSNENPNEADDGPINITIQPEADPDQPKPAPNTAEGVREPRLDQSSDSNAWINSSSSDGEDVVQSQQFGAFGREKQELDRLGARYNGGFKGTQANTKLQELLNRKKGFDVIDGEELFH